MENLSPLIKTIKAEMKRQEMSVQQLATHSGISFQSAYRIFNGECTPHLNNVEAMVKTLKLKISVEAR